MYALKLGTLLKSVADFWPLKGESKLAPPCALAVLVCCVANLFCDSGVEVRRELAVMRETLDEVERLCFVHCRAAETAACETGGMLTSIRREDG